jgi:hypothetical protein
MVKAPEIQRVGKTLNFISFCPAIADSTSPKKKNAAGKPAAQVPP